jgi:hypothetical protein
VQVEGFAGGGSSQCRPFVPVFSAFGVAAALAAELAVGLAAGLAVGLGAFGLTGGEGLQLLTITVKIRLNIPIRSIRFMGQAPLR